MENNTNNKKSDRKLIYLGVQPTPYTQYLLEHLRKSEKFEIEVYFTFEVISDLPWKNKLVHPEDRFFKRKFGIDKEIVKMAYREKEAMFYVLGYNEPTKFLVLLIRLLLGYPYSYFNDSIKLNKNFYHLLKSSVLPILFSGAKAIFTTGEFGIDRFQRSGYGSRTSKFVNFPFFVPLPELPDPAKDKSVLTFLCSGRLVDRKGFDDVLRALGKCKQDHGADFRLKIAGSGPNEADLRALAATCNITEEVEFLGWLEADQLKDVMLAADVFVHYVPILDPFPVAVLEAMAFGLPIIGSNMGGSVADRVENGRSGYVLPPRQVDKLAEAIMTFVREPNLAAQMGVVARQTAEKWPVERAEEILEDNLW
ncbi:MAG: glycosyltransferase family 4 protein [Lewinella sp.]